MEHRRVPSTASARVPRARHGVAPPGAVAVDLGVESRQLLALFTAKNLDALIKTAFTVIGAAVECDFVSALHRNVGNGLLRERDSRGREYGPAFMRRYAELTPAIPLVMSNPGIKILTTRTGLPGSTVEFGVRPFIEKSCERRAGDTA